MNIIDYTIGWKTEVKFQHKTKTFSSVERFYSFMKDHGIKYENYSSYSRPAVIINDLKDIEKLFS